MAKKILICFFLTSCFPSIFFAQNTDTSESLMAKGRIDAVIYDTSGVPVSGASVFVYLSDALEFRGPYDYVSEKSAGDGKTSIELPPGKYFIVGRKKVDETPMGPPKEGDFIGRFDKNPLEIRGEETVKVELKMTELKGQMAFSPSRPPAETIRVEGILKDKTGPVKNAFAMAHKPKEMRGKADYISRPTDASGRFIVYIQSPGKYFFSGREKYGGPIKEKELFGTYEEGLDLKASDRVSGIEIFLEPFEMDSTKLEKSIRDRL